MFILNFWFCLIFSTSVLEQLKKTQKNLQGQLKILRDSLEKKRDEFEDLKKHEMEIALFNGAKATVNRFLKELKALESGSANENEKNNLTIQLQQKIDAANEKAEESWEKIFQAEKTTNAKEIRDQLKLLLEEQLKISKDIEKKEAELLKISGEIWQEERKGV